MDTTDLYVSSTTGYNDYDDISGDPLTELLLALLSSSIAAVVVICFIRDLIASGTCKKGFYHDPQYKYTSTGNELEEALSEGNGANQEKNAELELAMESVKSASDAEGNRINS